MAKLSKKQRWLLTVAEGNSYVVGQMELKRPVKRLCHRGLLREAWPCSYRLTDAGRAALTSQEDKTP